ncbi:MAG: ISAs1 family transposase [Verrucomicrobia bacterium]|nr:ISAs1 family transposase [Verrucomicrobiota bacterium]
MASPDFGWFDQQLADHHFLGAGRPVGDYLRQIVTVRGRRVALLLWGPACYALKDRDRWLGWSATQRVERLKLIVQNRRFLLLSSKGEAPNLASQTLAAAVRALPEHWQQAFGYRPLLAESFTDPEAHEGTCYRASNWEPVGWSAGYSRHRADFYVPNERPKRLWLRELDPQARRHLRAEQLPADCQPGVIAPPSGVLPLDQSQMLSLFEVLQRAPDPRATNVRFRIGPVLTLIALALLAGRREIAEIARFATTLQPQQRRLLGLPRKPGTQAFYEVPTYSVFYAVLTRLDSAAFAALVHDWLQAHAGTLPQALALDGKMIRDHIGLLTLAQHEDGAPQAVAVYDQKEGTPRCEQTVATALLAALPALDGKTVTANALHCQKATARVIVGKGGDFLLQIKKNPPGLLAQAQAFDALPGPLFFRRPRSVTGE